MSDSALFVPPDVVEKWQNALRTREPRALELAYALALALPAEDVAAALLPPTHNAMDTASVEMSSAARALLLEANAKYDALRRGAFKQVDLGNHQVLGFERFGEGEKLLIINNLSAQSQPLKFRDHAGREGWDILNRVEFIFPARVQLEPYEFLWLLVE